jgi:hypothetical protein
MAQIQAENERSAERQRKHEEYMSDRNREDNERIAERQRLQAEASADRQRKHEIDMAKITRTMNEAAEERQKRLFDQLIEKNSKSFKAALEKEGEKEEKREKEKTSAQGALFHPLAVSVGDASLKDLPTDPGNYRFLMLFY